MLRWSLQTRTLHSAVLRLSWPLQGGAGASSRPGTAIGAARKAQSLWHGNEIIAAWCSHRQPTGSHRHWQAYYTHILGTSAAALVVRGQGTVFVCVHLPPHPCCLQVEAEQQHQPTAVLGHRTVQTTPASAGCRCRRSSSSTASPNHHLAIFSDTCHYCLQQQRQATLGKPFLAECTRHRTSPVQQPAGG